MHIVLPDASHPITTLQIGTASTGGVTIHSIARRTSTLTTSIVHWR